MDLRDEEAVAAMASILPSLHVLEECTRTRRTEPKAVCDAYSKMTEVEQAYRGKGFTPRDHVLFLNDITHQSAVRVFDKKKLHKFRDSVEWQGTIPCEEDDDRGIDASSFDPEKHLCLVTAPSPVTHLLPSHLEGKTHRCNIVAPHFKLALIWWDIA